MDSALELSEDQASLQLQARPCMEFSVTLRDHTASTFLAICRSLREEVESSYHPHAHNPGCFPGHCRKHSGLHAQCFEM